MSDVDATQNTDDVVETAETETLENPNPTETEGEDPIVVDGEDHLGDKGKQALDRMKAERNELRRELRELKAKHEPPEPAEAAADKRFIDKILRAEIRAAAAGKLHDPADAYRFLDLEHFEVSGDGEVDLDEINVAITDLLEKKPYLRIDAEPRRVRGSAAQGVRKDSGPRQLTETDLARLSPEETVAAMNKGLLNNLLGVSR